MATQKDLDVLKQKLKDLDVKLKSMGSGSPQRRSPLPDFGPTRPRSPVDMVRDPRFGSAMANQNYKNSMAEQRARMEADKANRKIAPTPPPEQGRSLQPNGMPMAPISASNGLTPAQIAENIQNSFTQGRLMGAPTEQQPGQFTANQDFQNFLLRDQYAKIEAERGIPLESRIKAFDDLTRRPSVPAFDFTQAKGLGGPTILPNLPQDQMQNYNNLLQQGIQRSNTMNQDAASNFANMQAGAPTTQPAAPAKANQTMPIAGMGMQQSRKAPAPRKFSTFNTPSSRIG